MQFIGKITAKGEKQTISEKYTKLSIVVEEDSNDKYPATMSIDFVNDKIDMLKDVNVGDQVDLDLNFRANESKKQPGVFFNSISCWRMTKIGNKDDQPF